MLLRVLLGLALALPTVTLADPAIASRPTPSLSSGRIHFKTIGVDDGLPHQSVRALLQDRAGFLWIGTQDGLARYDGRGTEVFRRLRRDADSIGDNHVTALAEDRDGRIWIAHQAAGLSRYDPRTQRFARFAGIDPADGLPSPRIQQLVVDAGGGLFVLSSTGALRRWDEGARHFVAPTFTRDSDFPALGAIAARRAGGLWLGTPQGLWLWDGQSAQARSVATQPSGVINAVVADGSGAVWIGTSQDGLWRLPPDGAAARVAIPGADAGLREVLALMLDDAQRLWAGTRAGVAVLDAASAQVLTVQTHRTGDPRGLASERVVSITQTRDGLIWVGTWAGGISVHDPRTEAFTLVREKDEHAIDLANQTAPAVLANADNTMWVARGYDGGLTLMDIDGGILAHYRHDPAKPESLASNFVMTLAHGAKGDIWVGTGDEGVDRLNADGSGFEHYDASASDPNTLPIGGVRGLYVEDDGTVWAGSMGGGIAVRCATCDKFRRFANRPDDPASFPADGAYSFLRTKSGELWVGTRAHGILRLEDQTAGRFSAIAGPVGAAGRLSHGSVTYLTEDPDGTVWVGTQGGGVNRLVRDAKGAVVRVDLYSTENGLSADAIGAILRDREGRLWITATRGISRINPKSGAIDAFEPRHGAQLSYYIGAGDRLPDGRFVLGGFDGVTVFDPAAVVVAPEVVQPHLTDLRVFNEAVRPAAKAPLTQALAFADRVTLDYKQDVVAFGFTAPVFRNAALLGLSYQLEGRDSDWIRADAGQRSASYSGLTAGDYRFRVRAWSVLEPNNANEVAVGLRVLPAPWATSWAYAGYLLVVALVALSISWPIVARVRERRAARDAIERSEQRLKLALWGSGDELWELDLKTRRVHRDNRLPGLPGADDDRPLDDFCTEIHVADQPGYITRLQAIETGLTDTFEHAFRIRGTDEDWHWLQARARVVARDADGAPLKLAGTHQDVSPLKLIQERQQLLQETLRHQAFHDALTGLANRALFYEQLALSLNPPEDGSVRLAAVLIADLDEFKLLNDSLGPSAGDKLLGEVADRLRRLLPEESGMVARLGGDEFAILVERTTPDQVFGLAERTLEAIRRPFEEDGERLHTTASIGVAFAQSGESADDALRNADLAMYRAKQLGRNRIEVFSPDLHHEFSRRLQTVAAVRRAIEDAAVIVHFQPIVELATGRWVGAEALARLAVSDPLLASPNTFIPIAEDAGLIDALGRMILRRAIDDARRIGPELAGGFFITVNVSPRQLQQPGLAEVTEAALRDCNWPANRLMLEITESTLMTVSEVSRTNLNRLRALGVRLALDDFGTGYSSLAQLGRERFDVLKIAKPFVDGLPGSADSVHMAEAIVRMAESLRMSVIAEGVEHPAQAECLRRLGCSYAQGYEFGEPMPAPELADVSAARMR